MIDDLDDILRELLTRELPIKNHEIDIAFDLPNREWSARLSRPTLNLYLHDVRENVSLRRDQTFTEVERRPNSVVQRRRGMRVDLFYLVTAWATAPEDQHRMLARALLAFLRNPEIPADLVPEGLQDQTTPIPLKVAQHDSLEKPSDLWSVLDNQQRPGLVLVATLAFNPYAPIEKPLTRTAEVRFGQSDQPESMRNTMSIRGNVRSKKPLDDLHIVLLERGIEAEIRPGGEFGIQNLQPGDYTLEVTAAGHRPKKQKIKVPQTNYDVDL